MKKKLLTTLALSTLVLTLVGSRAMAAEVSGKTDTDVEFEAGGRPEVTKPEEGPNVPEILDPDPDPRPELGNVYVTHLPDISFGASNKVSLNTIEYNALTEKRTKNTATEEFYMPLSAQVADLSGSAATKWTLSVAQDDVYKSANSELENARIRFYGNTITSSAYTNADILTKVAGIDLTAGHGVVPVTTKDTTSNPLEILNVTEAGSTNNSYTSAVFANAYDEAEHSPALTPIAERFDGVRLNVPASDQAQKEAYTAKLTWTLSVTP